MKYLLLLAVIAVAWMLWRKPRPPAPGAGPTAGPGAPQDMVRCAACEVHLPRADALADAQGRLFCSAEHRLAAPR